MTLCKEIKMAPDGSFFLTFASSSSQGLFGGLLASSLSSTKGGACLSCFVTLSSTAYSNPLVAYFFPSVIRRDFALRERERGEKKDQWAVQYSKTSSCSAR